MAKMFPSQPRYGTQSRAEIFLFHELEKQLDDDFMVFHSVAWQIKDNRTGNHDGETDFIIIHPFFGVLILEVKGGQITYESESDTWLSNGRSIKDPFQQGTKAKYSLLNKLKEIKDWNGRFVSIGNVIAVPDMVIDGFVRLNGPRELILDADDSRNISSWISEAFHYLNGSLSTQNTAIDSETLERLQHIFYPSWNFNSSLVNYFAQQNIVMQKLTEEQFLMLDFLQRQKRVAISGCAGSGKTLLALEKAIRLGEDGFKVLVLCNNPFLAKDLRDKVTGTTIQIYDFATLVYGLISGNQFIQDEYLDIYQYIHDENSHSEQWTQFKEPSPQEIDTAFSLLVNLEGRFDAVIVDEGQDFRDMWWVIAEACLQSQEHGIFYIFFDDNQAIFPFGSQSQYPIAQAPYPLSKNCRNAGKILEMVQKFYSQTINVSHLLAEEGIVEQWIYKEGDQNNAIEQLQIALEEARKYSPDLSNVVVVSAEIASPQQSILNGLVIRELLPNSTWQESLLKAFRSAGISTRDLELSKERFPTDEDIRIIGYHCRSESIRYIDQYSRSRLTSEPSNLKWVLRSHGLELPSNTSPSRAMKFFGRENWAKDLLFYYKPSRLTAIDDQNKYPDFHKVTLSDIPSFKGLEANGVILFYWGVYPIGYEKQLETNLCVGLSRARHLLYFISPFDMSEKIKSITNS